MRGVFVCPKMKEEKMCDSPADDASSGFMVIISTRYTQIGKKKSKFKI